MPTKRLPLTLLRYAVVPVSQQNLKPVADLPPNKGEVLALLKDLSEEQRKIEVKETVFQIGRFTEHKDAGRHYLTGKIAKKNMTSIGHVISGDFEDMPTEDWCAIWIVIDLLKQYIGCEINSQKIGNVQKTTQCLSSIFSRLVEEKYGYAVFVSGVTDAKDFWSAVEGPDRKIYEVSLTLVSPNILDTNKNARETLEAYQKMFNQTEITTTLKNKKGNLTINREQTEQYIEYISEGEGSWYVRLYDKIRRKKVRITSEGSAKKIETQIQLDSQGKPGPNAEAQLVTALATNTDTRVEGEPSDEREDS